MNISIRQYKSHDSEALKKLILELKLTEVQYDADFYTDAKAVNTLFEEITSEIGENGEVFVAEDGERVVGFASANIDTKNDELICKNITVMYMGDIAVFPEYRGQGIGKMLMERVEQYAHEKNVAYLKLVMCSKNKNLMGIYKKFGYEEYETTMLKRLAL